MYLRIVLLLSALLVATIAPLRAQTIAPEDTAQVAGFLVPAMYLDNELVPHINLPTITVLPPVRFVNKRQQERYTKLMLNIKRVYPMAKTIRGIFFDVHAALDTIHDKRERKRYINSREAELKAQFEGQLRKLTFSQGRLLLKLIDRETGHTTFEVVKELKGSFDAFFWQSLARIFGANLKSEYDSKGDDWMIEDIIIRIENGTL